MVLLRKTLYILAFALLMASCANRGIGPQGGPKDSIPPIPLHYSPEQGALEFKGKRIEVTFNEYLQLNDVASNLLMSPPQQTPPDVKARGKRLMIQFQDTLRDSTTYTLDFGDAVCDYHEKVPLHGFSFYFSTGSEIDTLETTGYVYDAETLNPVKGVMVGIHSNKADSAFERLPFDRIAKTDSAGFFRIGNIHQGTYRLYALDDISRDYRLTVGEARAYQEETISPLDSTPSILFLFKEEQQRLYLQKTTRDEQHKITLLFSAPQDSALSLRALRPSETDSMKTDTAWIDPMPYIHTQYSAKGDTVTLWLTDSIAIAQDSLFLEARYQRTDSLYNLEWYVDTIRAIWRAQRLTARMKEAQDRKNRNRRLDLKTNARKDFDLYDTLYVLCSSPLAMIETDSIHLFERTEAGLNPVPFTIAPYDSLTMRLQVLADWKEGNNYELALDSGALHDVYGVTHIKANYPLQIKTLSDYSTLRVKLNPFVANARIQVLDGKDQVLRELPAVPEGAFFEYLKPGTYYLRLYVDENGDGKWTTGNWEQKRQPEPMYYFPEKIQTKSNWDFDEEWDYLAKPQTESKPQALIKAAPKKK